MRESVCVLLCERANEREARRREGGRESSSANTGHEKCMEVVVSVCWSESCRERAETGFSERSLSGLSLTQPASAFHSLQRTSLVLLTSQTCGLYTCCLHFSPSGIFFFSFKWRSLFLLLFSHTRVEY